MDNNLTLFKKIVEENDYKFTFQKKIILKAIIESKNHLNAREIYEKINIKNIGLATVYRNLKVFQKLGIVKEIGIDGVNYYEMKMFSRNPFHVHLKCNRCGSIIDIDTKAFSLDYIKLNEKIEKSNSIEIFDTDIMFMGLCSKCKEDEKWQGLQDSEE